MADKRPLVGFIGQGWIGKHYADEFEHRGYAVIRYALEEPYRANKDRIKDCDIVFIAVPTPTTEKGFSAHIVEEAIDLVGIAKIAVIKSTILPGVTREIQQRHRDKIVLHSPEFLSEATAAHDAAHPFSNIVGMPEDTQMYRDAAARVHAVLPPAPFSHTCTSTEAELIKYSHNASAYTQITFFNTMYDLSQKIGADWSAVHKAVLADPFISNRYAQPVHKSGRGAGGHCFIKDYAALREVYEKNLPGDTAGIDLMRAHEAKNIELLRESGKDLDLLAGVYGDGVLVDAIPRVKNGVSKKTPTADISLLVCAQSADEAEPTLGFFHAWVDELARRTRRVSLAYLQGRATGLPDNVRAFSLGKDRMRGPRWWKRMRYAVRFWWFAWRYAKDYDTVLVYINTEYVLLGGLLWRWLGKKVALVASGHERGWKLRAAARWADVVLYADPRSEAARLANSQQIQAGVDTRPFQKQARTAVPTSLVFVGRIARGKRLDEIIEAVERAAKRTPDLHLDMYGVAVLAEDRTYEQELRERYAHLAEKRVIAFRGSIPHGDTPGVYASHDVFVHAGSVTGFNKALYEAMAAGCTVVTTDPALRSAVRDELFIADTRPETFARAIEAAVSLSPLERAKETAALRAYVEREHSLAVIIPRILEAIYPSAENTRAIGV